jgi:hypothetical protein
MTMQGRNVFDVEKQLRSLGLYYIVFSKYKDRCEVTYNPWRVILYYDKNFKVAIEPRVG